MQLQRVIFDTSAINALEDSGASSEPLMRGLECGFEVVLTAMSADEIISTKQPSRREALLSRFSRFLTRARCLWPPHEIVRLLISAHQANPSKFDWQTVDVRARAYEAALPRRDFDDPLCVEQRSAQFEVEERFAKMWAELRPHLDVILAKDPAKRPTAYQQAAEIATLPNGTLWSFGAALYEHVAGTAPTEAEIQAFTSLCPPFRTACYALVMAWYNGSLRIPDGTPTAQRNDLLMATYLPYCDRFITADWAQNRELAEIATEAGISCSVGSFDAFERSLALTG